MKQFKSIFHEEVIINEAKNDKLNNARAFCVEVRDLANKYNLPFFVVTDGASTYSNNGCEAVRNARKCHEEWERKHGEDPDEDWSDKADQYKKKAR